MVNVVNWHISNVVFVYVLTSCSQNVTNLVYLNDDRHGLQSIVICACDKSNQARPVCLKSAGPRRTPENTVVGLDLPRGPQEC